MNLLLGAIRQIEARRQAADSMGREAASDTEPCAAAAPERDTASEHVAPGRVAPEPRARVGEELPAAEEPRLGAVRPPIGARESQYLRLAATLAARASSTSTSIVALCGADDSARASLLAMRLAEQLPALVRGDVLLVDADTAGGGAAMQSLLRARQDVEMLEGELAPFQYATTTPHEGLYYAGPGWNATACRDVEWPANCRRAWQQRYAMVVLNLGYPITALGESLLPLTETAYVVVGLGRSRRVDAAAAIERLSAAGVRDVACLAMDFGKAARVSPASGLRRLTATIRH